MERHAPRPAGDGSRIAVRPATPADAPQVAAIYNEGIAGRLATFETEPRTAADLAAWIAATGPPYSFVVAVDGSGAVVGWAATFPYSPRPVYGGVAEYSVYVATTARGRGVGAALLTELLVRAQAAGLHKVTSRIFPENTASLALAERLGFRRVGTHLRHARLDGEWRDVVTVEVLLGPAGSAGHPH